VSSSKLHPAKHSRSVMEPLYGKTQSWFNITFLYLSAIVETRHPGEFLPIVNHFFTVKTNKFEEFIHFPPY